MKLEVVAKNKDSKICLRFEAGLHRRIFFGANSVFAFSFFSLWHVSLTNRINRQKTSLNTNIEPQVSFCTQCCCKQRNARQLFRVLELRTHIFSSKIVTILQPRYSVELRDAKCVGYNEVSLFRGSFPYILLLPGIRIQLFRQRQRLSHKSVKAHVTMPIGIMGRKSLALLDWGSRCLATRKEKAKLHLFVLFLSTSLKHLRPQSRNYELQLPIIPFHIVACGFVGQPFSKQLYRSFYRELCYIEVR